MNRSSFSFDMRPLPTYTQALAELDAYIPQLRSIVEKAYSTWQEREQLSAASSLPTGPRMPIRATEVYGMMEYFAREYFNGQDGRPEARLYNGIFGVVLAGRYFVRFKKFDDGLDVTNHTSIQNGKFRKQLPIGELTEAEVYLYVGYRPDKTFTSIEGVHLVCRLGDIVHWHMNLTTMTVEETLSISFETTAPVEEQRVVRKRVQVRKTGTSGNQATGTDDALPPTAGQ